MRNTILALTFALSTIIPTAFAGTDIRVLDRAWVTRCTIEGTPPPVVIITNPTAVDGTEMPAGVTIEGESALKPTCVFVDTSVQSWGYRGKVTIYTKDETNEIEEIIYSANVWNGRTVYGISDWAITNYWRANGALYNMESNLLFSTDGRPVSYDINFLRRAPQDSDYDPAIIMRIQQTIEDGIIIFTLVFKAEQTNPEPVVEEEITLME